MNERRVTFSSANLVAIAALLLLLLLLWQLRGLIVLLMMAIVLAASISPVVDWAERWHLPRWLSVVLVYLVLLAGLVGGVLLVGPTLADQMQRLARQLPIVTEKLVILVQDWAIRLNYNTPTELLRQVLDLQALTRWTIGAGQELLLRSYSITRGIVGSALSLVLALFLSGYMVSDSRTLVRRLVRLLPAPWDRRLTEQVKPVGERMGTYIRGRILVSLVLALLTTLGLRGLGLAEFSLGLGAIAGVTNLIPFLGPILGAVPALLVAIAQGGWTVMWVLLFYVVLQNLETYILDPLLVGSTVGIHPLYQLLSVIGGVQVLGILGAIIVPPWFAGLSVLVENLYLRPKLYAERSNRSAAATSQPSLDTVES
jgi:predicted PurR-regulated permease PerM